ncbi:Poly [ADP-ribose] polymerase 12 [Portunus trituberculatus]|uniref:Poly [ADP-ribose] polymerase 12 n=1 Tax=Portunus trituberculatus TaxID=210409 RepID=A0A5B7DM62_PORTR|nr:Poly [ADP-ribose] polymerase 12 [Portunus trituberculatus]
MPHEDNHSRPLPHEDSLSRPLPHEENHSRPLPREDNHSRQLPREDNLSRPLPSEDNHSRPLPHEYNHSRPLPREDNSRPLPHEDSLSRPLPREENHSRPLPHEDNHSRPLPREDNHSRPLAREDSLSRPLPREDSHAAAPLRDANRVMVSLLEDERVTASPHGGERRDDPPREDEHQTSQKVWSFTTDPVKANIAMEWEEDLSDPFERVLARRDCHTNHSTNQEKTAGEKIDALLQSLKKLQAGGKQRSTGTPHHYSDEEGDHNTITQRYTAQHDSRSEQHYPEGHQNRRVPRHYPEEHQDHMTPHHYSDEEEEEDKRAQHYKDREHGSRSQHPDYSMQDRSNEQLHDSDSDEQDSRTHHQGDEQDKRRQHHNGEVRENDQHKRQQHYQDGSKELAATTLQHDEQSRIQQHYSDEDEGSKPQHQSPKDEASRTLHAGQERHSWGRGEARGCVRGGPHWMGQREDHTHSWRQERPAKVQNEHGLAWKHNHSWRTAENDHPGSNWRQQHTHPDTYYRDRDHNLDGDASHNMYDEGDNLEPEDLVSVLVERPHFRCTFINLFDYHCFATESVRQVAAAYPNIFNVNREGVQLKPQIKLCRANQTQRCTSGRSCPDLHVCSTYISSWCSETPCRPGHSLYTDHNKAVLKTFMLEHLYVTHIKKLLKHLIPTAVPPSGCLEVCQDYNSGQCKKTDCQALHLCRRFVVTRANCDRPMCSLNHNPHDPACSMLLNKESTTPHTQEDTVTPAQGATAKNTSDKKSERVKESGQDSSSKATHKPDRKHPSDSNTATGGAVGGRQTVWAYHRTGSVDIAEICRFSVEGICMYEDQGCRRLHASQPFHWQVHKIAGQDSWFNLPAALVTCLEIAFCDPSKNGVKLPSLDPAQKRRLQDVLDQDTWYANFEAMVLTNSDYSKVVGLRRLCVQAGATPLHTKARTFNWFFCDVRGRWVKYGQVDSTGQANLKSNITSSDIEAHYLARPEQPLSFRNSQFLYLINFGAMTQTNQTTKAQRAVRRRPELHPSLSPAK